MKKNAKMNTMTFINYLLSISKGLKDLSNVENSEVLAESSEGLADSMTHYGVDQHYFIDI